MNASKAAALILAAVLLAQLRAAPARTVSVAAASNLQPVAGELGAAFASSNPGMKAEFRFASTGSLVAQILRGSPDGVLLAANMEGPAALASEGRTARAPKVYALGRLILFSRKGFPAGSGALSSARAIEFLKASSISTVAVADPKTAPYGSAAIQVIERTGLSPFLGDKLVYAANIAQAAQYALSAADAAFIAASGVKADAFKGSREGESWVAVDPALYDPIEQGMALLGKAPGEDAARAFAEFMVSPQARSILLSAGYGVP